MDSAERNGGLSSKNTSSPLQNLNSSLKRIRLNEVASEQEPLSSRSDSFEREWGILDLAELDEADLSPESPLPSPKKARTEDDLDDFVVPVQPSSNVVTDERTVLTETKIQERNPFVANVPPSMTKTVVHSKTFKSKAAKPTRSNNGLEDVFTHEQVRTWSEIRIKTWEHRRTNTEGFYYRFVDPSELQHNGPWSPKSAAEFMVRLEEWKARGIRIGTSWGIFSMGVSHKAGYQCSSYYRKLLENRTLTDPAYAWEGGKLLMVNKSSGGEMAVSGLSKRWDTDQVKEIEANVNAWIKEYHSHPGVNRSAAHKAKKVDSFAASSETSTTSTITTTTTTSSRSGSLMFRPTTEAPRVKATTAAAVPKMISLRTSKQPIDESEMIPVVDINDKLAEYSSFMKQTKVRQPISLTVTGTIQSSSSRTVVAMEAKKSPLHAAQNVKGQTGLSLFWKNIRPVRVECPEVPRYIIPKDVELRATWAHRIQPYEEHKPIAVDGSMFKEVESMGRFDWSSLSESFAEPVSDIQGVLADPPWNFIVQDGRNDGACKLTTEAFGEIMAGALELMPSGIVSIWTHKAILPEIVSIMQGLGCRYVENLVWYKLALNNANLDRASPYFRSSKEILLMFKKGDGFDIRHQRTADVIMDFEKPTSAWIQDDFTEPKPAGVFEMMETLLPDARYIPEVGRGRLLEIWAKKSQDRRPGWLSVHELKAPSSSSSSARAPVRVAGPMIVEAVVEGSGVPEEDTAVAAYDDALESVETMELDR